MRCGVSYSGGNHRANLTRSVEASLKQLDTDCIELLYLHAWDCTRSAEDVMRALDDLVRAGKVRAEQIARLNAASAPEPIFRPASSISPWFSN